MERSVSDSARNTALRIIDARTGAPLMIPGAHEVRAAKPAGAKVASLVPVQPNSESANADDRNRSEHQIEGGGAVSQRLPDGQETMVARLFRLFRGHTPRP